MHRAALQCKSIIIVVRGCIAYLKWEANDVKFISKTQKVDCLEFCRQGSEKLRPDSKRTNERPLLNIPVYNEIGFSLLGKHLIWPSKPQKENKILVIQKYALGEQLISCCLP